MSFCGLLYMGRLREWRDLPSGLRPAVEARFYPRFRSGVKNVGEKISGRQRPSELPQA